MPLIPQCRPLATQIVPWEALVPTPRPKPHGVTEQTHSTCSGHSQHLIAHSPRLRNVLGHIRRVGDVEGTRGKGQRHAVALHRAVAGAAAVQPHLASIGVKGHVGGPTGFERLLKEARAASDVEETSTVQRRIVPNLRRGVAGQIAVEPVGVGLLGPE